MNTDKSTKNGMSLMSTLFESHQAELAEKDAKIKHLEDEPKAYKFYYCESENSYLLGRRLDTMYYAHWHERLGFVWDLSRYLPWGETVDGREQGCAWGVHTYPSEPKEIGSAEWFAGFLAQRTESQQSCITSREHEFVASEHRAVAAKICIEKISKFNFSHKGYFVIDEIIKEWRGVEAAAAALAGKGERGEDQHD